jgi:hypothetical protein
MALKIYSYTLGAYDTGFFVAMCVLLGLSQAGKIIILLLILFDMRMDNG